MWCCLDQGVILATDNVSAADNGKKTSHAASPHRLSTAGLQEISHLSRSAAVGTVCAPPARTVCLCCTPLSRYQWLSLYCSVYCAVGTELLASKASVRIHNAIALGHLCTGTAGYELRLCMGVKFGSVRKWTKTRRETSGSHSGTADNSSLFGCDAACWPVVRRHGVAHQKTRTNRGQELGTRRRKRRGKR